MSKVPTPPILITGASQRIGAHVARRLLEAGEQVLVHYRSETDELKALQAAGADTLAADFADAAGIQAFAKAVRARYPQLRAVIHNASAFAVTCDDAHDAAQQFAAFFNIHMLTPFLLNRELSACLQAQGDAPADIIHITDIYADNPAPQYDVYCATKAGLQNLAVSAAKQLGPAIKVNIIQPGPIDFATWQSAAQQAEVLDRTLLKRTGGPEAIYQAVRSLMDNDFMTGAIIPVDGGSRWG